MKSPLNTALDFTGIITVPSAGTPVRGDIVYSNNGFMLKAYPTNTSHVWFFKWGSTKSEGFPLDIGETVAVDTTDLSDLGFDVTVSGEKICWLKY